MTLVYFLLVKGLKNVKASWTGVLTQISFSFCLPLSVQYSCFPYFSCFHFKYSTYSSLAFLASTSAYQTECKCWRAKFSARGGREGWKENSCRQTLDVHLFFPSPPPCYRFICSHLNFWVLLTWEPLQLFRLTCSPPICSQSIQTPNNNYSSPIPPTRYFSYLSPHTHNHPHVVGCTN